ncbi:uncharacterized protein TNCV_1680871 [Trichonephila clavipes]|nr:uncharacterized protein TNCV_1680871 [Trichonephila clavipes]
MNVCKCIVYIASWGAIAIINSLNSRRASSPLGWLVEEVERWEDPDYSQVSSLKIRVETSQIVLSDVWCSKLWLTTGVTYPFVMMNFVGLDLAFADQVASVTTTEQKPSS